MECYGTGNVFSMTFIIESNLTQMKHLTQQMLKDMKWKFEDIL